MYINSLKCPSQRTSLEANLAILYMIEAKVPLLIKFHHFPAPSPAVGEMLDMNYKFIQSLTYWF